MYQLHGNKGAFVPGASYQTLAANLETVKDDPNVEICVLAYGDKEVADTIKNDPVYCEAIKSGKLRMGYYPDAETFHIAHAKNMAYLLSSPDADVVCNIDADNFVTPAYINYIREQFSSQDKIFVQQKHIFRPPEEAGKNMKEGGMERVGHMGRVAMRRDDFLRYGYDESIIGWGGEDGVLTMRMKQDGFTHVPLDSDLIGETLRHDDTTRTANMSIEAQEASQGRLAGGNFPLPDKRKRLNPSGFGKGMVFVNFETEPTRFGSLLQPQAQGR